MRSRPVVSILAVVSLAGALARGDDERTAPAPASLVSLDLGGAVEAVWPYTSADLSATPSDPLNLVFAGEAAWRWRMLVRAEDRTYEHVWRQAARWLVTAVAGELREAGEQTQNRPNTRRVGRFCVWWRSERYRY